MKRTFQVALGIETGICGIGKKTPGFGAEADNAVSRQAGIVGALLQTTMSPSSSRSVAGCSRNLAKFSDHARPATAFTNARRASCRRTFAAIPLVTATVPSTSSRARSIGHRGVLGQSRRQLSSASSIDVSTSSTSSVGKMTSKGFTIDFSGEQHA